VIDKATHETALDLAALRALDLIDPLEVLTWAAERVGVIAYPPPTLLALASLTKPVYGVDVDGLLGDTLRELGTPPLTDQEVGLRVAKRIANEIVNGSVEPAVGARRIWWDVLGKVPSLDTQLSGFVAAASEWEDDPAHRTDYEGDIVQLARRLGQTQ
jgi:hypothetical protein